MWSYSQTTRSNIDEANKHLQALMDRITELEGTVQEQQQAILQKDEATHMQLMEMEKSKNEEVKKLKRQLNENQRLLEKAEDACRDKDILIARLREKSNMLSELVKFRPMIDKIAHCLHNASKLCVNDSDEEKNRNKSFKSKPLSNGVQNKDNSLKRSHFTKTAHSMVNLSTTSNDLLENEPVQSNSVNKEIKDRLAKSLLTGSTYDLQDEDYINSAVNYDVESPIHQAGRELYL